MPTVESFRNPSIGLTVISVYGEVKPAEVPHCIDHYYKGNRCNMVLFDFSDAEVSGAELGPRTSTKPGERWSRKGDRKAFVFPRDVKQEVEPVLQEYCRIEETGSNLSVFDSLLDANRWLLKSQEAHR